MNRDSTGSKAHTLHAHQLHLGLWRCLYRHQGEDRCGDRLGARRAPTDNCLPARQGVRKATEHLQLPPAWGHIKQYRHLPRADQRQRFPMRNQSLQQLHICVRGPDLHYPCGSGNLKPRNKCKNLSWMGDTRGPPAKDKQSTLWEYFHSPDTCALFSGTAQERSPTRHFLFLQISGKCVESDVCISHSRERGSEGEQGLTLSMHSRRSRPTSSGSHFRKQRSRKPTRAVAKGSRSQRGGQDSSRGR